MTLKLDTGKFKLVGGNLSADYVNTVGGRSRVPAGKDLAAFKAITRADKFSGYDDLVAWSRSAGILDESGAARLLKIAKARPKEAETVFKRALILRESLYRLFSAAIKKLPPVEADIKILNSELAVASKNEKLAYRKNEFVWEWSDQAVALDSMLWQVAARAAELLTAGDLSRLRQCGGDDCGWIFLDTSRNGTRLWCDMKDCGNLAKVRRYRAKKAA